MEDFFFIFQRDLIDIVRNLMKLQGVLKMFIIHILKKTFKEMFINLYGTLAVCTQNNPPLPPPPTTKTGFFGPS